MACLNLPIKTSSSTSISPTVSRHGDASTEHSPFNYFLRWLIVPAAFFAAVLVALVCYYIYRYKFGQCQSGQQAQAGDAQVLRPTEGPNEEMEAPPPNEDGLNEHGEAPPLYQPKPSETETLVSIPLRTLQEDGTVRREMIGGEQGDEQSPPRYRE